MHAMRGGVFLGGIVEFQQRRAALEIEPRPMSIPLHMHGALQYGLRADLIDRSPPQLWFGAADGIGRHQTTTTATIRCQWRQRNVRNYIYMSIQTHTRT